MKIAMIGQKGIPAIHGGIERHVEELAVQLVSRGHDVRVYTRPYFTAPDLKKYRGVTLISRPSLKTKHYDAITHTLLATIHAVRSKVDIIHYHGVGPSILSFLPKLLGSKAKVVSTFHCIDRKHQKWGFIARQFLRHGEWASLHHPDQTIAVSQTIKKYAREVYQREATYIPNGVEPFNSIVRKSPVLRRYGLRTGKYIISVSRLIPHKGVHHLINAYRQLKTDHRLVIVGDGFYTDEYVQYLQELAAGDPRIIFTGFQSGQALRDLFANAAVYVLPSETEGMPIAMLEAASHGIGIIASDIPENREVVYAGEQPIALTFATGDADDLRRVLTEAINHPALMKRLANRARKLVLARYNWRDIAVMTEALYRQLLNQSRTVAVEQREAGRSQKIAVSAA